MLSIFHQTCYGFWVIWSGCLHVHVPGGYPAMCQCTACVLKHHVMHLVCGLLCGDAKQPFREAVIFLALSEMFELCAVRSSTLH